MNQEMYDSPSRDVRHATDADIDGIALTTARAFIDHPWFIATIQEGNRFGRLLEIEKLFIRAAALPFGFIWVTDDLKAASMWSLTGRTNNPMAGFPELQDEMKQLAGDKAEQFFGFEELIESYQPEGQALYLGSLTVDPAVQGQGLGRLVLEPGFEYAKSKGLPIRLDASTPETKEMYEHFGFRVVATIPMPGEDFTTWIMQKD